jgi:hypothetical protein
LQGPAGLQGAAGAQGARGPKGPAGPQGASGVLASGSAFTKGTFFSSCANSLDLLSQTVTLSNPAKIYATVTGTYDPGNDFGQSVPRIELKDSSGALVAATQANLIDDFAHNLNGVIALGGILHTPDTQFGPPTPDAVVPAGTYTLVIHVETGGTCVDTTLLVGSLNYLALAQ